MAEAEWASALGPAMLPDGKLLGNSVGWHKSPIDGSLWMHAVVGVHFVSASVSRVQHAIEDNAWSVQQLVAVGERRAAFIPQLIGAFHESINIKHQLTGDTILHHCARERRSDLVESWLVGGRYTPIANELGLTAVQVAILGHEKGIARMLYRALAQSSMNATTSPHVTAELALLASTIPELVPQFLCDVEGAVVRVLGTFRSELVRPAEVLGLHNAELPTEEAAADSGNVTPRAWVHVFDGLEQKVLVAYKVVLMPELLGGEVSGPFHTIVERCNAEVFESKMMELVVQSKWERNVWPKLRWIIVGYAGALGLASMSMVASSGFGKAGSLQAESAAWVDVAQVAVLVVETAALGNEVHQQVRRCARLF